ncbi:hypothetical protein HYV43_04490 [Candidatus Micrarchaeota archaeon]|nr:hypothetical protein [Candidatus Micrarchaeota archaeon]
MNLLLVAALAAGAFITEQMGLTFVAILMLILAVLVLLTGSGSGSGHGENPNVNITEPFGPEGPIVVENKVPDVPYPLLLKLKHDWHDYRQFEYSFFNFGSSMHNVGNFIWQLLSGQRPPKSDH